MNGIKALLHQTPPLQFVILEKLVEAFTTSPAIDSAWVRGSIARNDYDRASDVDLVLVVDDSIFPTIIMSLDDLLNQYFSVILPGWYDSIVPNFGGAGFVYLILFQGSVIQIDLYLMPLSRKNQVKSIPRIQNIFIAPESNRKAPTLSDLSLVSESLSRLHRRKKDLLTQTTELFILSNLIKKRISRGQRFLNYSETYLVFSCVRNMVRLVFDPLFVDYGWYHFEENLRRDPIAGDWISRLEKLMFANVTLTSDSLLQTLVYAIELIHYQKPSEIASIRKGIEYLTAYFDPNGRGLIFSSLISSKVENA
jgi:predicted nucleotidyltransferase